MSDNNQTMYTARVVFDTGINKGSSRNYGSAYVQSGTTTAEEITVQQGQNVTFRATKNFGFKFVGWYNSKGVLISTRNPYGPIQVIGDIGLAPVFAPENPKFTRSISVTVDGVNSTDAVNVTSMNGYYDYYLDSTVAGNTVSFNTGSISSGVIPDGNTFTIFAATVPGYHTVFRVNGSLVSNQEQSVTGSGSKNLESGERSGDRSSVNYITIDNLSTESGTPISIEVSYVAQVPSYTVNVESVPTNGGTVRIGKISESSSNFQSITVPSGTSVYINATPAASFTFDRWESSTGTISQQPNTTFQVTSNDTWKAIFKQQYSSISVYSEPSNGGTVSIYTDGTLWGGNSINSNQANGKAVTISATPNANYRFLCWDCSGTRYATQNQLPVDFGETNKIYRAHFEYVPNGNVGLKAYTSTIDPTTSVTTLMSGNEQVFFKARYTDQSSHETYETIKYDPVSMAVKIQYDASSGDSYISMDITDDSPYYTVENGKKFKYTRTGFKYTDQYVDDPRSVISIGSWTDAEFDGNVWKLILDDPTGRESKYTLTGIYRKDEIYTVRTVVVTPSGRTNGISVSGAGEYPDGSSVTVSTEVDSGIDVNQYTFLGWYDSTDPEGTPVYAGEEYGFTISDNTTLYAIYSEKCHIEFSASPEGLGSVSCVDGESTVVSTDSWLPYGKELDFTCTPQGNAVLQRWTDGGVNVGSELTYHHILTSTYTNIVAYLMQDSGNKLTVREYGNGSVTVRTKSQEDTQYYIVTPDEGAESVYTIPTGNDVQVESVPAERYKFSSYTLYDNTGAVVQTSTNSIIEIQDMENDMTIDASFSFIPWISTLGTIMKVY